MLLGCSDPGLKPYGQVREIARNAKVQATHASMEYPPNSGNGGTGMVRISSKCRVEGPF